MQATSPINDITGVTGFLFEAPKQARCVQENARNKRDATFPVIYPISRRAGKTAYQCRVLGCAGHTPCQLI